MTSFLVFWAHLVAAKSPREAQFIPSPCSQQEMTHFPCCFYSSFGSGVCVFEFQSPFTRSLVASPNYVVSSAVSPYGSCGAYPHDFGGNFQLKDPIIHIVKSTLFLPKGNILRKPFKLFKKLFFPHIISHLIANSLCIHVF